MRKFVAFIKISWQEGISYRVERVIWTIIELGSLVPLMSLWYVLGRNGTITATQANYLMLYYLLMNVVSRVSSTDLEEWLIENIKDGQISRDLIKPFSFFQYLFANELAWRISAITFIFPVILFLCFYLSPLVFVILIPFLVISFIQRVFVSMLIAFSAFWIDQSSSLIHFKWMCSSLLGGSMLPLTFFPIWFLNFAKWTPFYGWGFFPVEVALGRLQTPEILFGVVMSILWTIFFYIIASWVWKKAVKRYGAIGG